MLDSSTYENYLYYQLIIMIVYSTLRNTALTGLNQVFGR